jgi:transposase
MRTPIFIRALSEDEQRQIQARLRSSDAFVLRRCQILLASARGERAPVIAQQLGCDDQTVRNVIKGFNASGLAVLQEGSSRPHHLRTTFSEEGCQRLQDLLHRSPRDFGKDRGEWTLQLAAQVSFEQGIIASEVSTESVRRALKRLKTNWKRAKHWITSPDPQYLLKKKARDRLIAWASQQPTWAIGFLDEVWWSRFALPRMHAWQDPAHPIRLVEQSWKKEDPDPKALACYGVLWQEGLAEQPRREQMSLRFVTGRPVSAITTQFLDWCCQSLLKQGKTNWLLIWDNASWHKSQAVRSWIRQHNQQVKQTGKGVRILPFLLPTQSPWLNPIEPKWVHGKRNVVEHDGLLTAQQLAERVCDYFGCSYEPHLSIPEKVA